MQRQGASLPFSFMRAWLALLIAAAPAAAQPLPVVQLSAGMHLIRAEVAADFASRGQGLMYRTAMPSNAGMLFIFDEAARHYDERALAALVIQIAAINAWNRLNVTTRQVAGPCTGEWAG